MEVYNWGGGVHMYYYVFISTISNTNMYIGALVIFLLNALFKHLFQAIVKYLQLSTGWPKK